MDNKVAVKMSSAKKKTVDCVSNNVKGKPRCHIPFIHAFTTLHTADIRDNLNLVDIGFI